MCQDPKKRTINLKNKKGHAADHKNWSRRSFLQTIGLAGGVSMSMAGLGVNAMASGLSIPFLNNGIEDRILVLIRLKGGNDGLNMIIPTFDYGNYANKRPTIKINQNQILDLNGGGFGIPSTMSNLMPLWNEGQMKIINSVGYDTHNLSHFASSDIWSAADQNIEANIDKSGWLGRFILNQKPDYLENLPDIPGAIKISSGSSITYHNPEQIDLAVNFNTPERLLSIANSGLIYDTENLPDECYYGDQVGYLRSLMNVTFNYAPQISEAYAAGANEVSYSNDELSRQLSIVSKLIKGKLGTKLYMVTLGGFDTHENQNNTHPNLMNDLSNAIASFYEDLKIGNKDNDVLSMTFSEFGRRVSENSGGTDHGTAAAVMFFGPALAGNGIFGADPDLDDLDTNGNLKYDIDFRSIYATLLEDWLCIPPSNVDQILNGVYNRIPELGLNCLPNATIENQNQSSVKHLAKIDNSGSAIIEYTLPRPANVDLSIYSITGQKIQTLVHEYQLDGSYQKRFINRTAGITTAPLVYKLTINKKHYSNTFIVN